MTLDPVTDVAPRRFVVPDGYALSEPFERDGIRRRVLAPAGSQALASANLTADDQARHRARIRDEQAREDRLADLRRKAGLA